MTVKGCAVTITTKYNSLTAANMVDTGHYPMTGVIEEGYYEEENDRKEKSDTSFQHSSA